MGCCISKCKPDPHSLPLPEFTHVQDKLVIPIPNKTSASPPSPTSSASSFTCPAFSNTTISSASSLSSSSSSSALTSKDRSFSNDFLLSCYKDNPHIVRISSLKEASLSLAPTESRINHKTNPSTAISRLNPLQKSVGPPMPLKRVRSSSPANLARQKSFRKEPERPNCPCNVPNRTLRSPPPSRRFDGGSNNLTRRMVSPKAKCEAHSQSVSSLTRRENKRAASPNHSLQGLRRRENCGFKIEETVVKEVESKHEMESRMATMEDIHNPLISLDCFIFL